MALLASVRLGIEGFDTYGQQSHCVMSLSKTLYLLLSTGFTQENLSQPVLTC